MDSLAKSYWIQLLQSSPTVPAPTHQILHMESWQLWNGDEKIAHPTVDALYGMLQDPITQFWWRRHNFTSNEAQEVIDWSATETHMRSLPEARRRWVTKYASGECGIGVKLQEWNFQIDAAYPRCSCDKETTLHAILCTGCDATEVWEKSLKTVQTYLDNHHTSPDVNQALITCLSAWRTGQPVDVTAFPRDVRTAIAQQLKIGWLDLLQGQPAKQWSLTQSKYTRSQGWHYSTRKWLRGLMLKLHHLA